MALRKAIISVMLSALLIGSTAIPVYAVEDKESSADTATDEVELEEEDEKEEEYDPWGSEESELSEESEDSEQSEESENTEASKEESVIQESEQSQEQSKEESKQESKEESKVQEQSKDELKEESKEESKVQEQSKEDESEKKDKLIGFVINFGCDNLSNRYTEGRIDFSNVKMVLLGSDKKTVIKKYDLKNILNKQYITYSYEENEVNLEWKEGSVYYLHFDNLPTSVYKVSSCDIPIEYKKTVTMLNDKKVELIYGIDSIAEFNLGDYLKEYNIMIFAYGLDGKPASNVVFDTEITPGDSNKVIYKKEVKTENGVACFFVPWDKLAEEENLIMSVSSNSIVNSGIYSGTYKFPVSVSNNVYEVYADSSVDELYVDGDGNRINRGADVTFNVSFNNSNADMSLFKYTDVDIELYSGEYSAESIVLSNEESSHTTYLSDGSRFSVLPSNIDYSYKYDKTLIVKNGANVNIEATPQLLFRVINNDGVAKSAHFKVVSTGNEYNEIQKDFSVNIGYTYDIVDLDTGAKYSVYIDKNKLTILNLATGEIEETGYVGGISEINNGTDGTDTSSGVYVDNNVYNVPKTGDIVFSIIMILTGMTGLSYLGYLYFKRRGKKADVKK